MKRVFSVCSLLAVFLIAFSAPMVAQGVTTAAISGRVTDAEGAALQGARITAVHEPSGTTYSAVSRADGRVSIPGMRVGGPYRVTAAYIGYESQVHDNVYLALGAATELAIVMRQAAIGLSEIVVTGEAIFSPDRTGAATFVTRSGLSVLPTVSGRLEDFTRLTPQASGSSFVGQDNRLNNITVDGSYFNNSFGLGGQPGDRTNVAPISMAAIEQVQINIAPYDVRQGNFVGAGVNTVTRSGTNEFSGSLYYAFRDQRRLLHGRSAGEEEVSVGTFNINRIGVNLGGPIVRNKLFFFASFEDDRLTEPGTTFRANEGGQTPGGGITRVERSDLDALSTYLATNFGYETGPYQGYDHQTPATRFITKVDYNLDHRNKVSIRYNHLDSNTDVLASNSSSLGFGNRRTSTNALNFQNSNYIIKENIRSIVGEWNSQLGGGNMSNNLLIGYSHHDESRDSRGTFFPGVDILEGGLTYTTFGFEPFTPNNELRYSSFQLQNSLTIHRRNHTLTFGLSAERYESENVFFPGSQSFYTYNSLDDFYLDANDFLAQCGTNPDTWSGCSRASTPNDPETGEPIPLRRFQVRWSNIPDQEKPIQPLQVLYAGIFLQDEWQVRHNLKVTLGLRLDRPSFGNTGFVNTQVDGMTFRDEDGNAVQYSTSKLPDANLQFSPRLGFNWGLKADRSTQIRGGSGIFSGRPAYVWISNQIGENGVLTGFAQADSTTTRPFHPDPDHYKPTSVDGSPAASYGLAFTEPGFRFPQLWRSNIAVDQNLPLGLVGTAEFLYNRDVNGIYYINANLAEPNTRFNGVDDRPRWTAGNRINGNVTSAIVLSNQNVGRSWHISGSIERPFRGGFFAKAAYSYGESKRTVDPGSIAFGSWNNNPHSGDPNNPGLGFSFDSPGHRLFATFSYRREYFRFGATTVSLFWEARTIGNTSYTFSGDLNGDGGNSNDLIYIHNNIDEMNFETFCATATGQPAGACADPAGTTITAQQQAQAWEAYIVQDKYLSRNRGNYAARGAVFLPMVKRADFSLIQEVFTDVQGNSNRLAIRLDILNVGNLIKSSWGVGQRLVTNQPLIARGADGDGVARYRLRLIGGQPLPAQSFEQTAGLSDVFRIQIGVRYHFN